MLQWQFIVVAITINNVLRGILRCLPGSGGKNVIREVTVDICHPCANAKH